MKKSKDIDEELNDEVRRYTESLQKEMIRQIRARQNPLRSAAFWSGAILNLAVFPFFAWLAFMYAGLLPDDISGFLSVSMSVLLIRACILDRGIA